MTGLSELFQKAYRASESGMYQAAQDYYKDLLKKDPTYSMAWNNLGWITYDQLQIYEFAEKCYKNALKHNKRNYLAWNNYGILYYRVHKKYKKAFIFEKRALEVEDKLKSAILKVNEQNNSKKCPECGSFMIQGQIICEKCGFSSE